MRESKIMSPLIPSILGLAVLVLAACSTAAPSATQQIPNTQPPSEEATPPLSGALVNACTYRVPEPTPTPDLTTPTATPFSNTTPVPYPTESPSAEVVPYPDLPPPALPASVEAWRDAVVRVSVDRASGRPRDQQGLVLADGTVLTVLDLMEDIASLSVTVSGRGVFTAELERFDPRTGAALLSIAARDLVVAPGDRGRVAPGEPVLLLIRDEDGGELVVKETYASPSLNAPNHLVALHPDYTPSLQRGTMVAGDGTPIGLASHAGRFYGQSIVWGGLSLRYLPAVLLDSAIHLLERPPSDLDITPAAVAYYRPDGTKAVDGPVTRELLTEPVQEALKDLGEPVPLESLSKRPGSVRPPELGTILELLYATPQELRGADGELLGSARYIALWWDREGGASDLVLCGTDDGNHLGATFATNGLRSFEALMEGAPSSSPHSMVTAARLRPPGYDSSDDYQYPCGWELKTDKSAYVKGEPVMLTLTLTNTSDWPVPLDYVPPRVVIHSLLEHRDVDVLRHGDERRVLQPDETASFTMTWDQMHFEGGRATPGHYVAHVHLANFASNWYLSAGPTAYEVILE